MDTWLLDDPRQYECLRTRKTDRIAGSKSSPSPIYVLTGQGFQDGQACNPHHDPHCA